MRRAFPAIIVLLALAGGLPLYAGQVAAAPGTPVLGTVLPTPVIVATSVPTTYPTISPEQSTPVSTYRAPANNPIRHGTTSSPRPTPVVTGSTIGSGSGTSGSSIPNIPLPSPEQLRQGARLRWGHHIPSTVRRWAFLIVPAARKYELNPNLIAAVMTMESNGDPMAQSGSDARGLMQILHGPWDPKQNVYEGARMLADLLARFHDLDLALAGYNAGAGAVIAYHGIPPYRETRDYVIVVGYLYDLFSNHPLNPARKVQYRSTVRDLRHFKSQRKKVLRLAEVGGVLKIDRSLSAECRHFSNACSALDLGSHSYVDPFWPLTDTPDPLQRVDVAGSSH